MPKRQTRRGGVRVAVLDDLNLPELRRSLVLVADEGYEAALALGNCDIADVVEQGRLTVDISAF